MARLLLVDDDIAEISAVKRVLARASLAPLLATNASDARAALAQRPADLLLVGATCEGGEALAMARTLAEEEAGRALPVIVLGGAGEAPPHWTQLPRPIDPAALAEAVQAALAQRRPSAAGAGRTPIGRVSAPAPAPAPAPAASRPPAAPQRPAFERRGPPVDLPAPSDAANARRAAAEALRARAAELRRAPPAEAAPAAAEAAAGLDALFELEPPAGVQAAAPPPPAAAAPTVEVELEVEVPPAPTPDAGAAAEAGAPQEAPPAEPAWTSPPAEAAAPDPAASWFDQPAEGGPIAEPHESPPAEPAWTSPPAGAAAPDPAASWFDQPVEGGPIAETPFDLPPEAPPAEPALELPPAPVLPAVEPAPAAPGAPRLLDEHEDRARAEEALAAEAEARLAREAERRAAEEAAAREEAARRAEAEAARAREAEARAHAEAAARAEAARRAEAEAARAREAEAAAREEAEARRLLQAEVDQLRARLDADREAHEAELRSAAEAARAAAARAAHEARTAGQAAAEEAASEAARRAAEEARARAEAEALARHQAALEALRAQAEAEAARRAEAEAALARLSEEATRLAAERAALAEAAAQAAQAPPPAPESPAAPPSLADVLPPDAAEEAARRRALSLRERRPAGEPPPPPAWSQPWSQPWEPPPTPPLAPAEEAPAAPEQAAPARPLAAPPAELRQGTLDELPIPRLLALAAQARLGGRLDFSGEAARSLWLDDGRVAGAASNVPGERVEEVALRLGLLTRDQHRQVAGAAGALATRRAALLLVERGYLKPAELTALVRRRTEEVAFGVFADAHAAFRWVPDPVPADERVAPERPPLSLAVEGVRRRWLAPRADAVLGGPASILAPAAAAPPPAELGLGADERRLLALADGLRTLDELLALSPLDALSTRQVLAAAVLTGALTVRVVHAGRPAAQVAAAIDLARVKEKLEQVRRADYFTILGVGRLCTPHEVREAADRLTAEFAAERFQGVREDGLAGRLEEIRRVLGEAREVLADDALRAEYLRGLAG